MRILAYIAAVLLLAAAGIALYDHVYQAGVEAEQSRTLAVQTKLDAANARLVEVKQVADNNEASALAVGRQLQDVLDAQDQSEAVAAADRDELANARAATARAACPPPAEVHGALQDRPLVTPEGAPLSASMKAAMQALRKGRAK